MDEWMNNWTTERKNERMNGRILISSLISISCQTKNQVKYCTISVFQSTIHYSLAIPTCFYIVESCGRNKLCFIHCLWCLLLDVNLFMGSGSLLKFCGVCRTILVSSRFSDCLRNRCRDLAAEMWSDHLVSLCGWVMNHDWNVQLQAISAILVCWLPFFFIWGWCPHAGSRYTSPASGATWLWKLSSSGNVMQCVPCVRAESMV